MSLQPGESPPLFTLLQEDGSRFELAQSLGRDRILIAFGPSLGWLWDVARREEELINYELQVLAIVPRQLLEVTPPAQWLQIGHTPASVPRDYGVGEGEEVAFLVGKDGGMKGVFAGEVDLDEVLSLIDTMPMRRAEVRGRGWQPRLL